MEQFPRETRVRMYIRIIERINLIPILNLTIT